RSAYSRAGQPISRRRRAEWIDRAPERSVEPAAWDLSSVRLPRSIFCYFFRLLRSSEPMRVWHTGACDCDRQPGEGALTTRDIDQASCYGGAERPIANGAIGGARGNPSANGSIGGREGGVGRRRNGTMRC